MALPPAIFERQLALLRRLGYSSGGLADLTRLVAGERLSRRTVFLTFDDGFRDNRAVAMPLLAEYGFRPLIFLLPRHVDEGAGFGWPEVAAARDGHPDLMRSLTWAEVEQMAAAGAEFGSHTLSHRHLCRLNDEELAFELADSRARIASRLGACEAIAYPFGEWDARVAAAAKAAGYSFAFSLPQGPQAESGPFCIPRLNVDSRDRPLRFLAKLTPTGRRLLLSPLGERVRRLRGTS